MFNAAYTVSSTEKERITMKSIQQLADAINQDCNELKYFWAYGLIQETASIWENESNRRLLNEVAQFMFECVQEGVNHECKR